ncbi:WXG100 family type VII secretion target [Mycolicibacterium sp.]|uniref:WXG100 family type VII secretion target n=1 Tax=Mycolicibacterium sp. TaxID=2320850 RepID=UPI003D0CAFBC
MSLVGADIEELRNLVRIVNQAAERLENTAGEITGRLASTAWRGPDAERYRAQWQGESVALIRSVVAALRTAGATIERNAAEQEQASSGAGASLVTGPMVPIGTPAWSPGDPLVDIRNFLGSNAVWPVTWGTLLDQATPLGPLVSLMDALGLAADDSLSPQEKIIQAGNALTDLGGGVLEDLRLRPHPVTYLGGVAVAQWGDVAANVARADFSASTLQATVDYVAKDPGGAFEAAKNAVLGYVPKLISNLLP